MQLGGRSPGLLLARLVAGELEGRLRGPAQLDLLCFWLQSQRAVKGIGQCIDQLRGYSVAGCSSTSMISVLPSE